MVGPHGCFFLDEDRSVTLDPARALTDLLRSGIALVLVSGRTQVQLVEACAIFGADGYVAELGAVVGWDRGRQRHLLRGAMPEELDSIPPPLIAEFLDRYAGRLEYHDPWHEGHQIDVMLRGQVDVKEVNDWLAGQGAGWLALHDNGLLPHRRVGVAVGELHVYHLVPQGIDKGLAVAFDLGRRGLRAENAVAIGDSASDLVMAPHVGRFHLVANGARAEPVRVATEAAGNAVIEERPLGLGWASAVRAALGD